MARKKSGTYRNAAITVAELERMRSAGAAPTFQTKIASVLVAPEDPMLAGLITFLLGIPFGGYNIQRVFIDRDQTVRVWTFETGPDNIPVGSVKQLGDYLLSIGRAAGLEPQEISEMLAVAEKKSILSAGLRPSGPVGPKLIEGPVGVLQMPWATQAPTLSAKGYSKADFLNAAFPFNQVFETQRAAPGEIEASKPWVGGRDFEVLMLVRTAPESTEVLWPYLYAFDPGKSIADGGPAPIAWGKDLWENMYWWVEKRKFSAADVPSTFSPAELREFARSTYGRPGDRVIIEYRPYWNADDRVPLPGWLVFFRFTNGQTGWFRPPPEWLLMTPEILGMDEYVAGDEIAMKAAEYHGLEWGQVGRRI